MERVFRKFWGGINMVETGIEVIKVTWIGIVNVVSFAVLYACVVAVIKQVKRR